jgi:antibiotic biosynthesis monooxygenase (ABM) superfamily enzyme
MQKMKNLILLALWAVVLAFLLSFFYWSDAPLAEQLLFGALMTVATGAWMLVLLNLPRAVIAARRWLKSSRQDAAGTWRRPISAKSVKASKSSNHRRVRPL